MKIYICGTNGKEFEGFILRKGWAFGYDNVGAYVATLTFLDDEIGRKAAAKLNHCDKAYRDKYALLFAERVTLGVWRLDVNRGWVFSWEKSETTKAVIMRMIKNALKYGFGEGSIFSASGKVACFGHDLSSDEPHLYRQVWNPKKVCHEGNYIFNPVYSARIGFSIS